MGRRDLEDEKLVEIMADFGFLLKLDKDPVAEFDHRYWNEAAYLYEQDFVQIEFSNNNFQIRLDDEFARRMAEKIDSHLKAKYQNKSELIENEAEPREILEPDRERPQDLLDIDTHNTRPELFQLALYPFGYASLLGKSDREILASGVEEQVGRDVNTQLELLGAGGYLERIYREETGRNYWRLEQDTEAIQQAESIARDIEREYSGDIEKYLEAHQNNQ